MIKTDTQSKPSQAVWLSGSIWNVLRGEIPKQCGTGWKRGQPHPYNTGCKIIQHMLVLIKWVQCCCRKSWQQFQHLTRLKCCQDHPSFRVELCIKIWICLPFLFVSLGVCMTLSDSCRSYYQLGRGSFFSIVVCVQFNCCAIGVQLCKLL